MSPCGMITDMLSSLSVQLFQLSDDPEDVAWGRWYWAQDGAKPLPIFEAFGSAVWEDQRTPERFGPQVPLRPAQYRSPRISPYPGLEYHGQQEWFETGLPLDQRECVTEEVRCGIQQWNVEHTFEMDCEDSGLEFLAGVVAAGGDVDNGEARIGPQSPLIVGLGRMVTSPTGPETLVQIPDGQVGDLLVTAVRHSSGVGVPRNLPTWNLIRNMECFAGTEWIVSTFKFREVAEAFEEEYAGFFGNHTGIVICLRFAGAPYSQSGDSDESTVAVYPPLDAPAGHFSTLLSFLANPHFPRPTPVPLVDRFVLYDDLADLSWDWIYGRYDVEFSIVSTELQNDVEEFWATTQLMIPPSNIVTPWSGDADGGSATTWSSLEWTADGGDEDGGSATTWSSLEWTATGGDEDAGTADITSGYAFTGAGGDGDGGDAEGSWTMYTGEVRLFASTSIPAGWTVCDGAAVSRSTYAALFSAIGTTWGAGDGSTTFNLPDLRGRVAVHRSLGGGAATAPFGTTGGASTHTLTVAEMPSHSHIGMTSNTPGGLQSGSPYGANGSTGPAGGDGAHNNMQPYAAMVYAIKH